MSENVNDIREAMAGGDLAHMEARDYRAWITTLLAALEHAERALQSCKAHAEEIRAVAKEQRYRADEAEAKLAALTPPLKNSARHRAIEP